MFPHLVAQRPSFRIALAITLCGSLLFVPDALLLVSRAAQSQRRDQQAARPRPGKPEGVLPDLEEVKSESQLEREAPPPIPSTIRSPKVPLQPWNGRRVGDPELQIRRAHARARMKAPPPLPDDQFVQNFFTWTVSRAASTSELTYWNDQLRAAYAQGQTSLTLAAIELGKALFESAEYAARNRNDHWYVYDLYKTFLMRDPDSGGVHRSTATTRTSKANQLTYDTTNYFHILPNCR